VLLSCPVTVSVCVGVSAAKAGPVVSANPTATLSNERAESLFPDVINCDVMGVT